MPRLERLAKKLELSEFEKLVKLGKISKRYSGKPDNWTQFWFLMKRKDFLDCEQNKKIQQIDMQIWTQVSCFTSKSTITKTNDLNS